MSSESITRCLLKTGGCRACSTVMAKHFHWSMIIIYNLYFIIIYKIYNYTKIHKCNRGNELKDKSKDRGDF